MEKWQAGCNRSHEERRERSQDSGQMEKSKRKRLHQLDRKFQEKGDEWYCYGMLQCEL